MKIEITKAQMLWENYNSVEANNYILCYGRVYIENNKYYRIKLIVNAEHYDCVDYYWNDRRGDYDNFYITHKQKIAYAKELALNTLYCFYTISELVDYCNKTIENYNKRIK